MELKPITRKEIFLQKIIDNIAMGGSSGGVTINNQDKTITENGTYTADEGYTGLGTVTVDVQSGGGDEASVLDSLIDRSITEISSNVESVGDYVFYNCNKLTSINFPFLTSIGSNSFSNCRLLTAIDLPLVTSISNSAFISCSNLTTVKLPLVTSMSNSAFRDCSKLTSIDIPLVTSISDEVFMGCNLLTTIDLPLITRISNKTFYSCYSLRAVVLRNETMVTLSNKNAFTETPIASGTGYIYVPRALVDTYKSATNWSTYATQFRALEDYTVDGTITGELDESKI